MDFHHLDELKERLNNLRNLQGDTDSRLKYYSALETAQTENEKQPFLDLIKENVKETMERIIKVSES